MLPNLAAYKVTERSGDESSVDHCVDECSEEELAAFALVKQNGEIGMTYTFPGHQRKGLAKALTWHLTKLLKEMNLTPIVSIADANKISLDLHKSLGYECISRVKLMFFTPKDFDTDVLNFNETILPQKNYKIRVNNFYDWV